MAKKLSKKTAGRFVALGTPAKALKRTTRFRPKTLRLKVNRIKGPGLDAYLDGVRLVVDLGEDGSFRLLRRNGKLLGVVNPTFGSKSRAGRPREAALIPPKVPLPETKKPINKKPFKKKHRSMGSKTLPK